MAMTGEIQLAESYMLIGYSREQRLCFCPQLANQFGCRFRSRQSGRLAGPGLHPVNVTGLVPGASHRRRESALYGIWSRTRRIRRSGGQDVIGRQASAGTAAEDTADDGIFGRRLCHCVCPRWVNLRFWTAQKARADLHRAGAKHQGRCYASPVSNTACGDDRHTDGINDRWQQGERSDQLAFSQCCVEAAAMIRHVSAARDDMLEAA